MRHNIGHSNLGVLRMGPVKFFKNVHSKEKDEACLGFLEEIFTKSVHRGGVSQLGSDSSQIQTVRARKGPI